MKNTCMLYWTIVVTFVGLCVSESEDLYNTKHATSDLQWAAYPDHNGWEELSNLDLDGNSIRSYQVCNLDRQNANNWVRTPYIASRGAKRAYIDVEFSMRKCDDLNTNCRETFDLFFFEADSDEASSTYPPWRENPYIKIDTIAAGERFSPSYDFRGDGVNEKTWTLGHLSRNGFYIAAHDEGACMSILSLRVYYFYCPRTVESLAIFPRTVSGYEIASLEEVEGSCVTNAGSIGSDVPKYYCNSKGAWTVRTGSCVCLPGFQTNLTITECRKCNFGAYKSSHGNHECTKCPAHSVGAVGLYGRSNTDVLTDYCVCESGYYRTADEDLSSPCSKPPSSPTAVNLTVNATAVLLLWEPPDNPGGRADIYYNISCSQCRAKDRNTKSPCLPCPSDVIFQPANHQRVAGKRLRVSNLKPFTTYSFQINSMNGVTSLSGETPEHETILVMTKEAAPSPVVDLKLISSGYHNVTVAWSPPLHRNGKIIKYEVAVYEQSNGIENDDHDASTPVMYETQATSITISEKAGQGYSVRVRAATSVAFGPYADPIHVETLSYDPDDSSKPSSTLVLVVGAAAAVIMMCLIVAAFSYLCMKKRRFMIRRKLPKEPSTEEEKIALHNVGDLIVSLPPPNVNGHRIYVDYPDPFRAMQDFSCELDPTHLKVEECIGRGEFGEVCRGKLRDKNGTTTTLVAVKKMKGGCVDQFNFLREASTMAQFSHPNVVRMKGVITKSQPNMIVTEFMENGSLDCFLQKKRGLLAVIQLVEMLKGIASGMKYLSSMKYVHRDLAARNILVNSDLVCKVSDFGLSRTLENDPHATYTTQGGKIAIRWTAPECIRFRKFTSASDVWSYGIVMWEVMSYGEKPYWDLDNQQVMESIGKGYRLPSPQGCPVSLHRLMVECWAVAATQRPKIEDVDRRLDQILRHPASLSHLHSSTSSPSKSASAD